MKRFSKWLKTPQGISLSAVFIGFILTVIWDSIKDKPVFTTIFFILKSVWNFIAFLLNFQLRVWWILIGIAIIVFVFHLIVKFSSEKEALPDFLDYTSDKISGWNWSWLWERQYDRKYDIENLHLECPNCETPLIETYRGFGGVACPRCNYSTTKELPDFNTIELLIKDNVRKKHYPQKNSGK